MTAATAEAVIAALAAFRNPLKAREMQRFFKTGPGEYAEGDHFWGLSSPDVRSVARQYAALSLEHLHALLESEIHEHRTTALVILTHRYAKAKEAAAQEEIVAFYLRHAPHINNWALVDISAPPILGQHLLTRDRALLRRLIASANLWEQRMALVATLTLIRHNAFDDILHLVRCVLTHPHDLIHKAAGWMLREVGKRDEPLLCSFLDHHSREMPRTMLRYAIERLPPETRAHYMKKDKK